MTRPSDISDDVWERAELLTDQFRHVEDDREFVARILMEVGKGALAGMTKRQHQTFDFIKGCVDAGEPPTMREIAESLSITLSRAHASVKQLEHRGLITTVPRCPRSIAIVGQVDNVSTAHRISVEE